MMKIEKHFASMYTCYIAAEITRWSMDKDICLIWAHNNKYNFIVQHKLYTWLVTLLTEFRFNIPLDTT